MDYNNIYNEMLQLEKQKIEYIKKENKTGSYVTLFQISIDILGKLIYLGKVIKKIKKT